MDFTSILETLETFADFGGVIADLLGGSSELFEGDEGGALGGLSSALEEVSSEDTGTGTGTGEGNEGEGGDNTGDDDGQE
ncbi:MAG TPA: hypothetical protein VFC72_00650 [Corynebacterium sp.]|nr:hypothetical protein [Corynebacterium sp.]